MELRPMTWGRWVELLVGAIFPTVVLGRAAALGLFFLGATVWTIVGTLLMGPSSHAPNFNVLHWGWGMLSNFWISVPGSGGIVSLWLLILFGPEQINQRRWLRLFTLLLVISGEVTSLMLLAGVGSLFKAGRSESISMMALIIAMLVGLKYLPGLIKGNKG